MNDRIIKTLLIDDDSEDTLLLTKLMAQSSPSFRFILECAEDLKGGLNMLAKGEIEVVLLDLMLPDSQGIETVRKVRSQFPDVPIVVLTGLRDESLGLEAVTHGAQDYQVKGSIDGHALKRTLSYAVERHSALVRLKNIIKGASDGMVVVDSKNLVRHVNPAAEVLFGCKSEQMLGKPFPHPISADRSGELKIPVEGGGERIAEMRISVIEWEDEPASLASIRDITELRRLEQLKAEVRERQRMDKLKDELMSTVSHEMRSPLTIIKAAASNIKEELTGPLSEQQRSMILLQYKNIQRLEKIVDNILDLSRLESGRAQIESRRVNATLLIRETLRGLRLVASEHNIMIQQQLPSDLPPIYADPELFIQVLSNLIDNAMRFTETRILVRAEAMEVPLDEEASKRSQENKGVLVLATRKFVQISVIDDGRGIPKDRIGDLFNKFVQVSRTSRGEGNGYKGTGLGLSICKEIIERQQGRIWVESDAGLGTRFHFLLPQYEPIPANGQGGTYVAK